MSRAVILSAVRTPIGRYAGALSGVRPDDLAAIAVRAAVDRAGGDPGQIEDVYLGCANQAGEDNRDVARMAVLLAGLPQSVAGVTMNRLCASGLAAVVSACHAVVAGDGDLFVAGGVESMSRAPLVTGKPDKAFPRGDRALVAAQAEGVLVLAADPVALGYVLAGLAHRLGRDPELGHPRVDHPPAEGGVVHRLRAAGEAALGLLDHPRRPAHRLDPAGQVEVALAELDRAGGGVDRLQARGAEAVDGRTGNARRQPGEQRRHPRHVAVVLARLVGGAEVDVGDPLRVDPAALDRGADRVGGEVVGPQAGERAAVGAHRRPHRLDYVGLGHLRD